MTSSTLAGERRWASARRGGVTVLGKVAVPKPLNLPSQRLENHGLDPNVEIVPKGTLSWGSRSSSGSNAWGSSAMSPNADGGTSSPSNRSGRPSSGGSGTRPSTANSDKAHEPTDSAWSSNSGPSSATGILSSNQTSLTSLRPRSAETRPNSSPLSRFAEPVSESLMAWGPSSTAERLGVKSSKEDGFSLSSGDFPTLGSDRDSSGKITELQDHPSHGRPSSASGRMAQTKEKTTTSQAGDTSLSLDVNIGTVRTWKRDGSKSAEDGIHPNMEKWQGEPQQYFSANVPSLHLDAWRGPPINAPAGVWYSGPPGGPPFGGPIAPGGFPIESFPYYRPQIPPPALVGSQPVPPPGAGHRGPHPRNGDLYRQQMPDAYARPNMPFRPGFYPGPMAFEGYYGLPMNYCKTNDQGVSFMGMVAGPPVCNRYSLPIVPDPSNSHGRACGYSSSGKTFSEQVEAAQLDANRGSLLLENRDECDGNGEGENWEHNASYSAPLHPGNSGQPVISSRKNKLVGSDDTKEDVYHETVTSGDNSSFLLNHQGHSSGIVKVKPFEGMGNIRAINDSGMKKSEIVSSFPPEVPHQSLNIERDLALPTRTKLKIEGLNAKVRTSDGRHDESQVDAKISNPTVEFNNTAGSFETSALQEVTVPAGDKMTQPTTLTTRRPYHGGQGRTDHRGKGKHSSQDANGWQKKPLTAESSSMDLASDIRARDQNFVVEAAEISVINPSGKEEESLTELHDSADSQAQQAKMRELAKQRALQLHKEEEERIREQMAKAFAKLEELNRRTQAGGTASQKDDKTQDLGASRQEQEELHALADTVVDSPKFQAPSLTLVSYSDFAVRESSSSLPGESNNMSRSLACETPHTGQLESVGSHNQSLSTKQDTHNASATKSMSQSNDGSTSRQKWVGYIQKQSTSSRKSLNENKVLNDACESPKSFTNVSVNNVTSVEINSCEVRPSGKSDATNTSNIIAELCTQQRRKSNKSTKNKHKLEEASPVPGLQPIVLKEQNSAKESIENGKFKTSLPDFSASSDGEVRAPEVLSTLSNKEAHIRIGNQWKAPQHRRMPRNQQAHRFMDKFHGNDNVMWAPVHPQNKGEGAVETSQKSIPESSTPAKSDNMAQISSKSKRAEMERYIPKPVAKELLKQGSIQQATSSVCPSTSNEATARAPLGSAGPGSLHPVSLTIGIAGSGFEFKEGDGRHSKQGKAHETWHQRSSTDSLHGKGVHIESSLTSDWSKDVEKMTGQSQLVNLEINSVKPEVSKTSASDSQDMSSSTNIPVVVQSPALKDQGVTSRRKRHPPKGHNHFPDNENNISGEADRSFAPDASQTERTNATKEKRSSRERASSHWQPKPHVHSAISQHGNNTSVSETVAEEISGPTEDYPPQHIMHVPRVHDESYANEPVSESNMVEPPNVGHDQESRKEMKFAPLRGRPFSPTQVSLGGCESASAPNVDSRSERKFSLSFRRNDKRNHGRERESHAAWASDNRQHKTHAFQGRQRQNVHYEEYQQVEPYKNRKHDNLDGPVYGLSNLGPRYGERGRSKNGGNF